MAKRTRDDTDTAYEEDELMGEPEDEEDPDEFEIEGALKAPRATTYSASSLFSTQSPSLEIAYLTRCSIALISQG